MKTAEIRHAFLSFFNRNKHEIVDSSSLVPADDPTLLFTNAGMNQFKDTFLGKESRAYNRATTSQKCVRAGGKHNDLENVGYTARHHTFFEMLGNFSFGDYFKQDAIRFAWQFLTEELNIPQEKLWVTVYKDDKEAEDIWFNEIGIDQSRFSRLGEKDNFWSMGDTGPCGPCTEIFYDHGEDIAGDPPGGPNDDGDRYIEIWNLVFMQFNRTADGVMHDLPKPSVDTGMGLERIAAVMQDVHTNYEIDLFQTILNGASKILGGVSIEEKSLRVIADHIRASAFLISDGVMPSNEGRGYTLRRIIRRAIRHGNKLGASEPFFYRLVEVLIDAMGEAYPELKVSRKQVEQILLQEEEQFSKTLDKGMKVLESDIASLDSTVISGATVFTLYDTYGFPVDLTNDIARERGLTLDHEGYEAAMETQRERARASSKFGVDYNDSLDISGSTEFVGYESFDHESEVLSVTVDGENAKAGAGEQCIVVLASTPFYAESGGQAGDTGVLEWDGGKALVKDTQKQENHFLHICQIESGELSSGVSVKASIDSVQRDATALNHSATHLLHAALRQILGEHVVQKGSLCNGERLRFDFAHYEAVTPEQLLEIESMVNARIRENSLVTTTLTDIKTAKQMGAMALFGEKYGENVRVLSMGDDNFSVELCGGTHAQRTGDIGSLVIVSEGGISSGVRRIEALSGAEAEAWNRESQAQLKNVASVFKAGREDVLEKANQWVEKCRALEKELEVFKQKAAADAGSQLADKAVDVAGVKVVAAQLSGVDRKGLEDAVDKLKNQFENAVVLLASVDGDKIALVAGVTKSISKQYKAGDLMKVVAAGVGGKGGGRPDFAKGGGTDVTALEETLASVAGWVESQQ
ncbi:MULTISPECIES: alanine--tRNA ligase [unclassified Oleiphilus]|jgi:alanyl-tRNA synthetase|uniref:alanine--tRNA ligase n=5 Tax=Oleiphilus TaxID=141450 RepID=UPI0007C2E86F|nr:MULTISPECIES: alanine--tRNA ligase [unclassified Oleiphilus]KZY45223.1 alanine--tRNA ligase [Oleiphilus sp. HI0050]KZY86299.1 alanine--tRNA ligase [Oleiphilus sp. HI0069]KZZ20904.1 alanine--tRNA ligase [Oleiphilus sp. HI0081]KZY33425.1 alanine--tRNA ligase [Oleiphilus sp. HI0043]KZY64531.1 alanine--tRNA ligase [Oleiphilus sp. HI0061]